MTIKINGENLQKRIINGYEVERVMLNSLQIRPDIPNIDYLCFTAVSANSTIRLDYIGSGEPTSSFEISTNKTSWNNYTAGVNITLANIGDKVYRRNTSSSTQGIGGYFHFSMTGRIAASGDVGVLLNSNSTLSIPSDGLIGIFEGCTSLITPPSLPATFVSDNGYKGMFKGCTSLTSVPSLLATSIGWNAYEEMFYGCTSLTSVQWNSILIHSGTHEAYMSMFEGCTSLNTLPDLSDPDKEMDYSFIRMFYGCSSIKLSTTQTGEYQTPYTINGDVIDEATTDMFTNTGGTFTGTPSVGVTYYTSNTVI